MTEKSYGGENRATRGIKNNLVTSSSKPIIKESPKKVKDIETQEESNSLSKNQIDSYKKAGQIAKQIKDYARKLIQPEMRLSEIAEKIEAHIVKLGGEVAFPVNLSINDIAAHYTPTLKDETKAEGLLKVDFGVHINGCIADVSFSLDLTKEKKYTKLIESSESALKSALELVKAQKEKTKLNEIGKTIQKEMEKYGFSPIVNLSGHGLDEYDIHSGFSIPNFDNKTDREIGEGAFAIEPFATLSTANGLVYDGTGSNIYQITKYSQVRDNSSREILSWLVENKKSLPFSQRELERVFGSKALIAISNLKRAGIINEFMQLVEKSHSPVSQAETSLIIYNGKVEILCE